MDLLSILGRVRKALLRMVCLMVLFGILSYIFSSKILEILYKPLDSSLFFYSVEEPFLARINIGIFGGLLLLTPFLFYELSLAVVPLFSSRIRLLTLMSTLFATLLFFSGIILAYFVIIPSGLKFLLGYESEHLKAMLSLKRYLSFSLWIIYSFGIIFELPLIMLILNRLGIVNPRILASKRKYAILIIAIASAVLTPTPDAYNMILMMGPLILLYEISILTLRISSLLK